MRQILSAILLFFLAVLPLQARTDGGSLYERGYRGNVGLNFNPSVSKGHGYAVGLESVHGYSFGNGAFLGGGIGLMVTSNEAVAAPIFLEAKYAFLDRALSPFVSMRGGFRYMENYNSAVYISPAVGVDIGDFSVSFAYQALSGAVYFENLLNFTVSWNF